MPRAGRRIRWIVGLGALAVAAGALYVLIRADSRPLPEREEPAMDEIDEESREAMRELLRGVDGDRSPGKR